MRLLPLLASAAVLAVIGLGAVAAWMRTVEDDPADWHVDLRTAERTADPHDHLVSTTGYTVAEPEATLEPAENPVALLERLDAIAMAEPRTARLAGSPAEGRITWVQRSAVFAFPDYVTAQADEGGWAIWSRSRYGRSDLGVNERRVERWREALGR